MDAHFGVDPGPEALVVVDVLAWSLDDVFLLFIKLILTNRTLCEPKVRIVLRKLEWLQQAFQLFGLFCAPLVSGVQILLLRLFLLIGGQLVFIADTTEPLNQHADTAKDTDDNTGERADCDPLHQLQDSYFIDLILIVELFLDLAELGQLELVCREERLCAGYWFELVVATSAQEVKSLLFLIGSIIIIFG